MQYVISGGVCMYVYIYIYIYIYNIYNNIYNIYIYNIFASVAPGPRGAPVNSAQ